MIPKKYRRKLVNEYNYFHEFVQDIDNEANLTSEEDNDCIICMTSLRY